MRHSHHDTQDYSRAFRLGVTLNIASGERHCIIGPNGAGKTTCFNLVSGRFPITSGEILMNGTRIDTMPPHRINRMGLSREKVMINIQRYGNTTAATIPLCLWEWENRLKKGDNIVLAAFGGGFTWGATLVKWAY